MKQVIVLKSSDLKEACRVWLKSHRDTADLVVAQIALVADLSEKDDDMAIRAHVVAFDTMAAAAAYLKGPEAQTPPTLETEPEA